MYFVSAQNPPKVLNNHSDIAAAAAAAAIGSSSDRQEPLNCRPRCRCSRKQEEKLMILDAAPDRARRPKQSLAATRKHVLFRPAAPPGSVMHNGWTSSERRCPPTTSAVSREGGSWAQRWRWNGILKVMVPHGVCGKKKKSVKWTCEIVPVCVVSLQLLLLLLHFQPACLDSVFDPDIFCQSKILPPTPASISDDLFFLLCFLFC